MQDPKKSSAVATASDAPQPLPDQELLQLGQAIAQVVGATTNFHGADCLFYAGVAAKVLQGMGYPARMVAGSAAWRVGPGDGDVISHALELNAPGTVNSATFAPANSDAKAVMFHAWVEVGDDIIDFTTASLADKAAQLDKMDGGRTQVDWSPQALWVHKNQCLDLLGVVNAPDSGVCAYQRHEKIEGLVMKDGLKDVDLDGPANAVGIVFRSLKAGRHINVIGLGEGGPQTLDSARNDKRGYKPA